MKKTIFIVGVVLFTLSIVSCKTAKQAPGGAEQVPAGSVNNDLVEKYWKLIELYGHPVTPATDNAKTAHIIFKKSDNQFHGNAGCNTIIGNYELKEHNRIVISPKMSTLMMCLDMETETRFLQVLETADSYLVRNDTLTLNRARMAPLARFVAVYLR
jgi:heat shock protein HslJ